MTTQRERQLLEQVGNASRGMAIVNQSIAAVLRLFAYDGRPLRRDDLRTLGHNLVSLAGALTDLASRWPPTQRMTKPAMAAHRRDLISEDIAMDRQIVIDATHEPPSRTPATRSRDYDPTLLGGGSVVPYIGSWTGEETQRHPVVRRPEGGIGFADETLLDRDEWGLLWSRTVARIGAGRPLFKDLHPRRQRRAMLRLLCQVCAQPADRNEQGSLWLMPGSDIGGWDNWPEGMCTIYPPLCEHCAQLSVRMCPALRTGYVVLRSHSQICGVSGLVFRPTHPFPNLVPTDYADVVFFDHPAITWTLATQLARTLIDPVTVVLEP